MASKSTVVFSLGPSCPHLSDQFAKSRRHAFAQAGGRTKVADGLFHKNHSNGISVKQLALAGCRVNGALVQRSARCWSCLGMMLEGGSNLLRTCEFYESVLSFQTVHAAAHPFVLRTEVVQARSLKVAVGPEFSAQLLPQCRVAGVA